MTSRIEREFCDECGKPVLAYFFVELPSGLTLSYCRHCGTKHESALKERHAKIYDLRYILEGEENNG